MEQPSNQPAHLATLPQQTACWYRAMTLVERLVSWPTREPAQHAVPPPDEQGERNKNAEAEKLLQRWKAQEPFDRGSWFGDRLALDGITEQELLMLLAETPEALQKRLSFLAAPEWVGELVDALNTDACFSLEPDLEQVFQSAVGLRPFYPLLQKSIRQVQAGIAALSDDYHPLPFDPTSVLSLLLPNLLQQLQPQMSKPLALELNIARLRGHLHGEVPEERFQDYLHKLGSREQLQSFLEEYTVLARQILQASHLWATCSLEFLQRLCADWPEVCLVFAPDQEPGILTRATGGAGDTHRGGHSVMILTFHSGWQLVYKPKSLTVDIHFQELLAWLNNRGLHPTFRLLKLIDKGAYGWSEWIAASDCSSEEEVARFYERQGGYLALLYALDATDFHYENVIAAGEHPLLIDLEALFHPRNSTKDGTTSLAQQSLEHSVLRSLLLPRKVLFNREGEGLEIGGLSHRVEGQLSPHPIALWDGAGTDEMKLVRRRIELRGGNNCPRLSGQERGPLDYLESLVKGFTSIYLLLMEERVELLTKVLPRFACDEIRFVARSTNLYAVLLAESFHPNLLRDALNRERFFDRLWLDLGVQSSLPRLIPAERADLLRGDIPLFTTHPESLNLWTSQGECLPAFFARSSLEMVNERIQQLSEADLQQQIWFIRASFTSAAGECRESGEREPRRQSSMYDLSPSSSFAASPDVAHSRLLAEARAIGDRLCTSALLEGERADWVGLSRIMEHDWLVTPAGLDLYAGLPGILLFLGYLGWTTEETRYTDLAQAGLNTLRTAMQRNQAFVDQMFIGAFTGLGSLIYLFSHLAALWNDPALLKEAEELVQPLADQIEKDEQFDLVDGAAGCLASLLSLYAFAPSDQTLKMARLCGEHLLAHAQPMQAGLGWKARHQEVPLSGFSRGAAGIAWSLLRLAEVSGEQRFQDTARAALDYERRLFAVEQRNWLDLRRRSATPSQQRNEGEPGQASGARCGMSWSHGAAGIALGRLASLSYLDDATLRTELEIALETTLAEGFGYSHAQVGPNHSLAHGDCGNLESILLAAQTLRDPQWHRHLQRLTVQLLESVQLHGWVMGVPLNIETPGLMLGLAGIGYQCLRLTQPERVPSVLTLAPPKAPVPFSMKTVMCKPNITSKGTHVLRCPIWRPFKTG